MPDNAPHKSFNVRLKEGDTEVFHELYKEYFGTLQSFAMRYVYDLPVAQDIVQDAFLRLWDGRSKYDPAREPLYYMIAIVRNSCVNYLKSLRIKDSHRDKIIEGLLFADIDDPEMDEGMKQRLHDVLAQLPEKGHRVLIEHIVMRRKMGDIAREMGVAESTVKTHLHRAMKILREKMMFILIGI